jgi:hypothetical protein
MTASGRDKARSPRTRRPVKRAIGLSARWPDVPALNRITTAAAPSTSAISSGGLSVRQVTSAVPPGCRRDAVPVSLGIPMSTIRYSRRDPAGQFRVLTARLWFPTACLDRSRHRSGSPTPAASVSRIRRAPQAKPADQTPAASANPRSVKDNWIDCVHVRMRVETRCV